MTNFKNDDDYWKIKNNLPVSPSDNNKLTQTNVNKEKTCDQLDNLFNELNILNEQTVGKLENMIALTKLSECKYEEAIPYLRTASQKGYQKASYNLALCYQDGLGVVKDEKMV